MIPLWQDVYFSHCSRCDVNKPSKQVDSNKEDIQNGDCRRHWSVKLFQCIVLFFIPTDLCLKLLDQLCLSLLPVLVRLQFASVVALFLLELPAQFDVLLHKRLPVRQRADVVRLLQNVAMPSAALQRRFKLIRRKIVKIGCCSISESMMYGNQNLSSMKEDRILTWFHRQRFPQTLATLRFEDLFKVLKRCAN